MLNLDKYEKFTVQLGGEEYEVIAPNFDNLDTISKIAEEWENIAPTEDDPNGWKQLKKVVKKLFVEKPKAEVLNKMNTVQINKLMAHILEIASGTVTVDDEKKSS